jgi:hypothetical protein
VPGGVRRARGRAGGGHAASVMSDRGAGPWAASSPH